MLNTSRLKFGDFSDTVSISTGDLSFLSFLLEVLLTVLSTSVDVSSLKQYHDHYELSSMCTYPLQQPMHNQVTIIYSTISEA